MQKALVGGSQKRSLPQERDQVLLQDSWFANRHKTPVELVYKVEHHSESSLDPDRIRKRPKINQFRPHSLSGPASTCCALQMQVEVGASS